MNKTVSIIIPCYNKADTIARAIQSAAEQTYKDIEIIVVDDGSTDNSLEIAEAEAYQHGATVYTIPNSGVANARNYGILQSSGGFVATIDADDWIEPTFIEKCMNVLLNDRTVGIAYTRLMTHLPNGTSKISQWPGEFQADKQFSYNARMNQIPTCCVFRREGFDRVGGYRKRYAPKGAGSEDAALWTAMLSTGYKAKLATNEPLFNYTAFSGNVSGNKDYQEPDWLAWYPWVRTGNYPFAAPNTPAKMAHVVRDYSEPIISIVVPVGDGHSKYLQDCIDSIEAQEFWQWELILVDDTTEQAIESNWFMKAYPFAKIHKTGGKKGAGFARNLGASKAKGNFLFFLDSDDLLNTNTPKALGDMVNEFKRTGKGVYTAYIGRSYIEDISKLDRQLQRSIIARDERDNETWIVHKVYPFRCEDAIIQPRQDQAGNVYIWCNVSSLIPRQWHIDIGGFDETMQTWEDIDYWWRMAKAGKCFTMWDEPALIYRFYSSTRREFAHETDKDGVHRWQKVLKYLKTKHERIKAMGCNCGSKAKQQAAKMPASIIQSEKAVLTMADNDFIKVEFHFRGEESRGTYGMVLRSHTGKRDPNGRILEYGPGRGTALKAGDIITVHRADQLARPDLFKIVTPEIPQVTQSAPKEPEPVAVQPVPATKELPAPPVLNTFSLDTLPITSKQKASLLSAGLTDADSIKALGLEGIAALSGFGKVSAAKLLSELE